MSLAAGIVLLLVCGSFAKNLPEDGDECSHPPPHHHHHGPHKDVMCCNRSWLKANSTDMDNLHKLFHDCFEELKLPKPGHQCKEHDQPPQLPPHLNPAFDCLDECVYKKSGLLTEDLEMKKDVVKEKYAKFFSEEWESHGLAAFDKCSESFKNDIDESSTCKSGAKQLHNCYEREVFLNCPADKWTESEECTAIKERLVKCPRDVPPHPKGHHKGPKGPKPQE